MGLLPMAAVRSSPAKHTMGSLGRLPSGAAPPIYQHRCTLPLRAVRSGLSECHGLAQYCSFATNASRPVAVPRSAGPSPDTAARRPRPARPLSGGCSCRRERGTRRRRPRNTRVSPRARPATGASCRTRRAPCWPRKGGKSAPRPRYSWQTQSGLRERPTSAAGVHLEWSA